MKWFASAESVKSLFSRVFAVGKSIANLEARVTKIEMELEIQSGDACPYCGKHSMRKTEDGKLLGAAPHQWKQDVWTCKACNKFETRIIKY
jgi:ribosomal protein L37AE/L43A